MFRAKLEKRRINKIGHSLNDQISANLIFFVKINKRFKKIFTLSNTSLMLQISLQNKNFEITLTNVFGQAVSKNIFKPTTQLSETSIDIKEFSNGIYLLSVGDGKKMFTKNIIVEHE